MSKTRARLFANGYKGGRKATRWERFKWLIMHKRAKVEIWLTDDNSSDVDFLVVLFAALMIALAGIVMIFFARG